MSRRNRKRRQPSVPREIGTEPQQYGPNGVLALQERLRVSKIIERDERAGNHDRLMSEERAAQAEFQRVNPESDPLWAYQPRTTDKPAKFDALHLAIVNPEDPKSKRRYGVIGPEDPSHPLRKAYEKHKIDGIQYGDGNIYRIMWEKVNIRVSGRDSTQAMSVNGGGQGFDPCAWTPEQLEAKRALKEVHRKMGQDSAAIIEKFCGIGLDMAPTIHSTVPCDKNGVLSRLKEAFRALRRALSNDAKKKSA